MSSKTRKREIDFEQAARDYAALLPLEHYMEGVSQATQRKLFIFAAELVHVHRPDIQAFNELLVQWVRKGRRKLGQVVPDNMVVVCEVPIKARGSYAVPEQPVGPFWVLEYVSKNNRRKDYEDSYDKYEKELKVPYYLIYYPDNEELTLYHHNGTKYVSVKPNEQERYAIPELEMEVGLLKGWARFWFRGKLLPLPADLQRERDQAVQQRNQVQAELGQALHNAEQLENTLHQEREAREALQRQLDELRAQLLREPGNGSP
jgi:Uma2 family endonuclease